MPASLPTAGGLHTHRMFRAPTRCTSSCSTSRAARGGSRPEAGRLPHGEVTGAAPFQTGTPTPLFKVAVPYTTDPQYDVSPDGRRFLVNQLISSKEEPITVLLNWAAVLKKP